MIQLIGDLGAGKTSLVRGIAKGLGSVDEVASPSFTIAREYQCKDSITLHHFDFYRLEEPGIMAAEIEELIGDPKAIVAVEWGDSIEELLPEDHIRITLTSPEETVRSIRIQLPIEDPQ